MITNILGSDKTLARYGFQVGDPIFRLERVSEQTECLFYPSTKLKQFLLSRMKPYLKGKEI
ncbi:MAG TPA: hypothetical protein ENI73_04235 [Spirochaetes bacterium]|nr:hypothetical protein [Spirochaetota bacterium]